MDSQMECFNRLLIAFGIEFQFSYTVFHDFYVWLDNLEFIISYAAVRNLGNEVRTGLQIFNEVLNISFRCYYHYYITINLLRRRKTSCPRKLPLHITWKYDQCTDPFIFEFQEEESICKKSNNCMQYPIDLKMMIGFSSIFFYKNSINFYIF